MKNAYKFREVFGLYATELWAMPEKDFLEWLNDEADTPQTDCEACELDGKADVCKICRASNYEPQTDCAWK